jgi:peptidyl-prolyl cis-trans isomerase SurA
MKKNIVCTALLSVLCLSVSAQTNLIDGVIWIVGEDAIMRSEVEIYKERAIYERNRIAGDPYCVIPEQLAIQKLFIHQAQLDSIVVNDGQVETQVNLSLNHQLNEIGSREKMEGYYNKSYSEIRNELRETIRNQMLMQQMQQKLIGELTVTPSEVRKFYETLPPDSIPTIPASVEVQILTLEPAISLAEREATKERLREYAERVNSGNADFSVLARLYSDDSESAKQGGDLGFFGRGVMVPEFTNVAFGLQEVGKVSRVVETEFGYHIIQLVEKRSDRIRCRHLLLRPRVSTDVKTQTFERLDSISAAVRLEQISFEQAVNAYSSDKNTRMNKGAMVNINTGASRFEYQELPDEVAKKVYDMNVGEISAPFAMIDKQLGREVYAIVKLKSKLPNHKANLQDDYNILKQYYESIRKDEIINSWIENKIKDTYVYILPEWRNCTFKYDNWIK